MQTLKAWVRGDYIIMSKNLNGGAIIVFFALRGGRITTLEQRAQKGARATPVECAHRGRPAHITLRLITRLCRRCPHRRDASSHRDQPGVGRAIADRDGDDAARRHRTRRMAIKQSRSSTSTPSPRSPSTSYKHVYANDKECGQQRLPIVVSHSEIKIGSHSDDFEKVFYYTPR